MPHAPAFVVAPSLLVATSAPAAALAANSDDPTSIFVGGRFDRAGDLPVHNLARWGCPCPADCDRSGSLDLFDFLCFINAFNTAGPAADCDQSGGIDPLDFLCFTNRFSEGC